MLSSEESTCPEHANMNVRCNKDIIVVPCQYNVCEMSNLPLFLHQHVLHSAVKSLPPQHVHSLMPHTVQSTHSVKTIRTLLIITTKARNGYNVCFSKKPSTLRCAPLLSYLPMASSKWKMSQIIYFFQYNSYNFTLFCKSTLAPCCNNTLTTSTCPF